MLPFFLDRRNDRTFFFEFFCMIGFVGTLFWVSNCLVVLAVFCFSPVILGFVIVFLSERKRIVSVVVSMLPACDSSFFFLISSLSRIWDHLYSIVSVL